MLRLKDIIYLCCWMVIGTHALQIQRIATGGSHSCALLDDESLKCWGDNEYGQLGLESKDNAVGDEDSQMGDDLNPVDVGTTLTVQAIAAGNDHTCALLNDYTVKCWGYNRNGELGLGDIRNRGRRRGQMGNTLPTVNLGTGRTAVAIAAGAMHSCALLDDGTMKCWGLNLYGQLGQGNNQTIGSDKREMGDNLAPINVGTGRVVIAIAAGKYFTCALLDDRSVKCWGYNAEAQLGQGISKTTIGAQPGEMGDNLPPINLGTDQKAVAIACGFEHVCVILESGRVKCWGDNNSGQLGLGNFKDRGTSANSMGDNLAAVELGTGRTAVAIAAGGQFTCALLNDGSLKCWGDNESGQLGKGDDTQYGGSSADMGDDLAPIQVGNGRTVRAVSCGYDFTCALLDDSTLKCWGYGWDGQLGQGNILDEGWEIGNDPNEMGDNLPPIDLGTGRSITSCELGEYSEPEMNCISCPSGTWALAGAQSSTGCISCPAGSFSGDAGSTTCTNCSKGEYSSSSGEFCTPCPKGQYLATATTCNSCKRNFVSLEGSDSEDDCQNVTASFAFGFLSLFAAVLLLCVYMCLGRARHVAQLEQRAGHAHVVAICNEVCLTLMGNVKRPRTSGLLWKLLLGLLLFVASFVALTALFIANTFVISRGLRGASLDWLKDFNREITEFSHFPGMGFMKVFPALTNAFASLQIPTLFDATEVTCEGARAPTSLFFDSLIMIGTVIVIDSGYHIVIALAFLPTMVLLREKIMAFPAANILSRISKFLQFISVLVITSLVSSSTRFIMQFLSTLTIYRGFYPSHRWTDACNEDGVDKALARGSTVLAYLMLFPVVIVMTQVLMPGFPGKFTFPLPSQQWYNCDKHMHRRLGWALGVLNPTRCVLAVVHWVLKWERERTINNDGNKVAPGPLDSYATAPSRLEDQSSCFSLFLGVFSQGPRRAIGNMFEVLFVVLWKLSVAIPVAMGIWDDISVDSMRIDEISKEHFGWVKDHSALHEDVIAVVGSMRSMVWMLIPPLIVLTKLAEATNNPPVMVTAKNVKITSPILFRTWEDAEAVTVEGEQLLFVQANHSDGISEIPQQHGFEHRLRVAMVWLFGARLPRYCFNLSLFVLAVVMTPRPSVEILIAVAFILLLSTLLYALASMVDVPLLLRLRKLRPRDGMQEDDELLILTNTSECLPYNPDGQVEMNKGDFSQQFRGCQCGVELDSLS